METERNHENRPDSPEEPPPLFSTWNKWYIAVFLNLVFLIALFSIFTRTFR